MFFPNGSTFIIPSGFSILSANRMKFIHRSPLGFTHFDFDELSIQMSGLGNSQVAAVFIETL